MILDILKDRFAIVAWRGNSAAYPGNSPRALMSAVPDSDIILTDVTACKNGVLFCTKSEAISNLPFEVVDDMDIVSLRQMINWAKETDKHLLLNPRTMKRELLQRIAGDARYFGAEDRISVVARSLAATKYVQSINDKIGIVGVLDKPTQYASFYKSGGHVATLARNSTTPENVRLAECAEGRHRHPFLVLAPNAGIQDVFNAYNGLVGAGGIIMANPEMGREALERRSARPPVCAGFSPD